MAQLELLKQLPPTAQVNQKSEGAYRTISEVAEELDVPQHVLRFWESHFPQVKPSRMRGSRRYYRPEDVEALHKIKTLLYEKGFTIKGAKKFIRGKEEHEVTEAVSAPALPVEASTSVIQKEFVPSKAKPDVQTLISELRVLKAMLTTLE